MNRNKLLVITTFTSLLLLTSCVKAAKNIVDDLEQSAKCLERVSEYTADNSDKTCSQITTEIDKILKDCGEFLTQEDKDDLNSVKNSCTDN